MRTLIAAALALLWAGTGLAQTSDDAAGVSAIQQRLKAQGYYAGGVTGRMDQDTTQALDNFQRDLGIRGGGVVTDETLAALGLPTNGQTAQIPGQSADPRLDMDNRPESNRLEGLRLDEHQTSPALGGESTRKPLTSGGQ